MTEGQYLDRKVVWILGSGFSKSLGGPLLYHLLSHRGEAFVQAKFPKLDRTVYRLFRQHLVGQNERPVYWDHAEEFLDFVSTAAQDGNKEQHDILRRALQSLMMYELTPTVEEIYRNALQCLAAECVFTTHTSTESEAWRPYRTWARGMREGDTIVTFNYDMVLERLGEDDRVLKFGAASVLGPTTREQDVAELDEARVVKILKLHGSVSWFKMGTSTMTALLDSEAAKQLGEGSVPVIVGPGPEKVRHQEGELKILWKLAEAALKAADVIVFLGYRFPPSDSQSRTSLLGAIGANTRQRLKIHTVLGPRVSDDDTVRLTKLLEHTLRAANRVEFDRKGFGRDHPKFVIENQPLYVEDFLSVLHARLLHADDDQ